VQAGEISRAAWPTPEARQARLEQERRAPEEEEEGDEEEEDGDEGEEEDEDRRRSSAMDRASCGLSQQLVLGSWSGTTSSGYLQRWVGGWGSS